MTYKHILCATDFSDCSENACEHAVELVNKNGAALTLLHVIDHFPQDSSNRQIAPENADPKHFREEKAMAALKEQAARCQCPEANLAVSFSNHSSAYEIIRFATACGADLIVVAAHEHAWFEKLFGDTAKYVERKAGCDVVVVPAR